ncbi:MAG: sigma-54-dependent Fis family transcriptional regulator [Planctomycetes bacterium]|nr:sigma-54-dependent Fis family transcriptional regulator [Planctomycetota bacterium]
MTPNRKTIAKVLIVEDEEAHAEGMREGLARVGYDCTVVHSGESAVETLAGEAFDIVLTDLMLGGPIDGLGVQAAAKTHAPKAKVIVITAHSSVETCRHALQEGAFDYIEKPLELTELRTIVARAAEVATQAPDVDEVREELSRRYGFDNIVAKSPEMLRIIETARRVAGSDLPVLLLGESGTGKDLLASTIHQNSRRASQRLVPINCAGLSETLLEDELFGHVKGAYTGATADRPGRFEHAGGGTLFLDEVGDMPLAMQAKLLRVLENGEVVRVGSNEPIRVNVRIISATNSDLAKRVEERQFREDLYFRIKGVTINVPPLRERREDIPLLIDHFLANARNTKVKGITADARRVLMAYPWPGNIRQLRSVVDNMIVMASGDKLTVDELPDEISRPAGDAANAQLGQLAGISIEEAERRLIANTLKMVGGNREQAANILGIGERTLYRKIKDYDLRE